MLPLLAADLSFSLLCLICFPMLPASSLCACDRRERKTSLTDRCSRKKWRRHGAFFSDSNAVTLATLWEEVQRTWSALAVLEVVIGLMEQHYGTVLFFWDVSAQISISMFISRTYLETSFQIAPFLNCPSLLTPSICQLADVWIYQIPCLACKACPTRSI